MSMHSGTDFVWGWFGIKCWICYQLKLARTTYFRLAVFLLIARDLHRLPRCADPFYIEDDRCGRALLLSSCRTATLRLDDT